MFAQSNVMTLQHRTIRESETVSFCLDRCRMSLLHLAMRVMSLR